jgi:GcrA cell cycle regulator
MNLAPTWTDARIGALKQLAAGGLTATKIAAEMGISRGAVIGKLARIGVPLAGAWTMPQAPRVKPPPTPRAPKPAAPPSLPAYMRPAGRRTVIRPERAGIYGGEIEVVDVPEARELPPDASAFACTIVDLTDAMCKWPIGHPADFETFRYCGDVSIEGRPYCTRHHALAHKPYGRRA